MINFTMSEYLIQTCYNVFHTLMLQHVLVFLFLKEPKYKLSEFELKTVNQGG